MTRCPPIFSPSGAHAARESQTVEFKQGWRDEFLKGLCEFANAQGGTQVLGGVKVSLFRPEKAVSATTKTATKTTTKTTLKTELKTTLKIGLWQGQPGRNWDHRDTGHGGRMARQGGVA